MGQSAPSHLENDGYIRDVKVHILVTLTVRCCFQISRATALDLHAASSLLLDVLYVRSAMTNDLSAKIETRGWFQINGDLFHTPFTLPFGQLDFPKQTVNSTYSTVFITLNLILISAAKTAIIYQLREILLDEFLNLLDSLLQAFLASAGNVEVERGVLARSAMSIPSSKRRQITYSSCCHVLVGVVIAPSGDILQSQQKS